MPRYSEAIIANTLLDRQNEKLTVEALESLVYSLNKYNIPIMIEHDPRIPPIGRIIEGYVRQRQDKEFEAVAILEFFDSNLGEIENNGKELIIHKNQEQFSIGYSFSHKNKNDLNEIQEVENLLNSSSSYEAKKSADPISIITLTAAFIVGGIATGFLNQLGANVWDALKPKLIKLSSKHQTINTDDLLIFRLLIKNFDITIEVEIILTNPIESDLDIFITQTIPKLDQGLEKLIASNEDIRKVVLEQKNTSLILKYAVTNNGIPLFLKKTIESIFESDN